MPVTVHPTVALHLPEVTLTGEVRYDPRRDLLEIHYDDGETEVLSLDLTDYGLVAPPGTVWIKDWTEHVGLADALVMAGVVAPVGSLGVGPFFSRAYLVRVLEGVAR